MRFENYTPVKSESAINKVVTSDPEKEKVVSEYFEDVFSNQEMLREEREKTERELSIMNQINKKMKYFIEGYGGKYTSINPENVHILDTSKFSREMWKFFHEGFNRGDTRGKYMVYNQNIFLAFMRPEDELAFAKVLTHELIHLNAFQSINVKSEDENDFSVRNRRGGLRVVSNTEDFDKYYFDNLDEAVTEELANRFVKAFFNEIPELKELLKSREKIKENEGFEGEPVDISIVSVLRGKGFWASYMMDSSSYIYEREYLWKLIDELYEINQNKFNSKEEVFDFFAKAALSGKLLPLARLIESSKGKGSFRMIGGETSNTRPMYEIKINEDKEE